MTPVGKDEYNPEELEPSPIQEEYAPVIFAQDTVAHVISLDMMSGKEDRENVLRARALGKGVLTVPLDLIKSNRLGVILTFAVYKQIFPLMLLQRKESKNGWIQPKTTMADLSHINYFWYYCDYFACGTYLSCNCK